MLNLNLSSEGTFVIVRLWPPLHFNDEDVIDIMRKAKELGL